MAMSMPKAAATTVARVIASLNQKPVGRFVLMIFFFKIRINR